MPPLFRISFDEVRDTLLLVGPKRAGERRRLQLRAESDKVMLFHRKPKIVVEKLRVSAWRVSLNKYNFDLPAIVP